MKVNKKNKRSSKAFTLIELLMVISVIALIAAITLNSLRGARESARISNALSFQHQVHSLLGADLVAWWNFDNEPVANQFRDISGGGNTGTCTGLACPTPVDGVPGTRGTALSFDGVDDFVSVPHSASLNITGAITIGVWVKRTGTPSAFAGIVAKENTDLGVGYGIIYAGTANPAYRSRIGGLWRSLIFAEFPLNTWRYVVATYDGSFMRVYLDGIFSVSQAASGSIATNTFPLSIGRQERAGSFFAGLIDDVRIYSRALTASEIQTLYAQTRDKYLTKEK